MPVGNEKGIVNHSRATAQIMRDLSVFSQFGGERILPASGFADTRVPSGQRQKILVIIFPQDSRFDTTGTWEMTARRSRTGARFQRAATDSKENFLQRVSPVPPK